MRRKHKLVLTENTYGADVHIDKRPIRVFESASDAEFFCRGIMYWIGGEWDRQEYGRITTWVKVVSA